LPEAFAIRDSPSAAHLVPLALAERICLTFDRVDPARVHGSFDRFQTPGTFDEFLRSTPPITTNYELTFRSGRTLPARARSSGSETLLRIRSLAGYTIDTYESAVKSATVFPIQGSGDGDREFQLLGAEPPHNLLGFGHGHERHWLCQLSCFARASAFLRRLNLWPKLFMCGVPSR
jgi:hypothetical protein